MLCCKRIDTTLRGNVGEEIDGMLDALPEGYRAIVVTAYPRAGRICVGGHVLVNGEALTKSGAENDPVTPIRYIRVEDNIRQQSGREMELVDLQTVREGRERICALLRETKAQIVIFDAISEPDIETIAQGCRESGILAVCVDPGGFSVKMAQQYFCRETPKEKNLLVIGSLSEPARKQIALLEKKGGTLVYRVNVKRLLTEYGTVRKEAADCFAERGEAYENFCLMTENVIVKEWKTAQKAETVAGQFTRLGVDILIRLKDRISCVYLSGGDTAKGFMERLPIRAVDVKKEVMPLAVYGKAVDEEWKHLQILTKGGMIGGEDAVAQMLQYAKEVR